LSRLPPSKDLQPLLLRIAANDPNALAELYDATSRQVYGILRRMLWSPDSAANVAQEVYARVWTTSQSFDPDRESPWPWLALLTRRLAIERMRKDGTYPVALEASRRKVPAMPMDSARLSPAGHSRQAEIVRAALHALPGDQRRALEMAFFGGLSHREIAERTGTPLDTVQTRIRAALLQLADPLDPEIEE
jgi:RNA polymerase sigma-70 factor, ECF subfamily